MKKYIVAMMLIAHAAVARTDIFIRELKSENFWTQIHAAEYLIDCDRQDHRLQKWLEQTEKKFASVPVKRIGAWRVKAQQMRSCGKDREFQQVIWKLKKAVFTADSPDKIHALETLFKLGTVLDKRESAQLKLAVQDKKAASAFRIYGAALLSLSDAKTGQDILLEEFSAAEIGSAEKFLTVFVWKNSPVLPEKVLDALKKALDSGRYDSAMQIVMRGILLDRGRIGYNEFFSSAEKLPSDGAELLRLTVKHAPEKASGLIEKCAVSSDNELQMLAAWAKIKIKQQRKK